MTMPPGPPRQRSRIAMTAAFCVVFVAGMVGMAYAAVPLYRIFCALTGYGGTTQRAKVAPSATVARTVTVRFDTNIGNGLGWSFRPEIRQVTVKLGEPAEVAFLAENRTAAKSSAVAAFNVTPGEAGAYFDKISCFCFKAQTLNAGESVRLPVVFFVDPAMVNDHDLDGVDTITLSYTFFPAAPEQAPAKPVAEAPAGPGKKPALTSGDGNG
jgi:cytochrome c oxidase assembly protein subunit 11